MKITVTEAELEEYKKVLSSIKNEDTDNEIARTFRRFNIRIENLKFRKTLNGMYEANINEETMIEKMKRFVMTGGAKTLHGFCKKIMNLPDFITKSVTKHFCK